MWFVYPYPPGLRQEYDIAIAREVTLMDMHKVVMRQTTTNHKNPRRLCMKILGKYCSFRLKIFIGITSWTGVSVTMQWNRRNPLIETIPIVHARLDLFLSNSVTCMCS